MTDPGGSGGFPTSAPDLIGPVSILNQPVVAGGRGRRKRALPLRHVHLEIDLAREARRPTRIPILRQVEQALGECLVEEAEDLLVLSEGVLRGCSAAGFGVVERWSPRPAVTEGPKGALPLDPREGTTVHAFLGTMSEAVRSQLQGARGFTAALRASDGRRLAFVLRRIHRERRHALSLDLSGPL
ncbi:MAG: hypothetical protein ACRECR_01375, partial [Thermoplasmata archaeon]